MVKNVELRQAWEFVENTGKSIFLTGKAGTGKTTFLRTLKERSHKRMVVVAPTGVNIASMQLYRSERGGYAVMVLETDQPIPDELRVSIQALPDVLKVTVLNLDEGGNQ